MPVGIKGLDARSFDPDAVAERTDRLSDAFVEVANAINPDVGVLMLRNDHNGMEAILGGTDPSAHGLDTPPFMLVLGETWVSHCGGHDHVMDAPVYQTKALETGGVVVQTVEHPDVNGDYHDGAEYFFGE